ncbi:MAG: alpha-N-arabinofuranosidase [Bryobacteraceae bacterium]
MTIGRRDFLKASTGAAALLAQRAPLFGKNDEATIDVFPEQELGTISRNIYGHFTEHIGGVIYDGVWVGENSKIPNTGGIRKAITDGLRRIHAPVIRWPGGCFADSYDWRDGIGPRARRPTRTNFWEVTPDAKRLKEKGAQLFESNAFGTDEFVRFCKLSGAEPYLAGNLRSLPALALDQWVEYCNSPAGSTTYARIREAGGSREPFGVRYWGVGNESWGCGGNFRPEDYATEFRRYTDWIPSYGEDLYLIGSGPSDDDTEWTRRFFEQIFQGSHPYDNRHFRGWSMHHYSRSDGEAVRFNTADWYELLKSADQMEKIITDQWSVMGNYDRQRRIKLVVDEYGPWHRSGTEIDPTHLFGQQITIRDALATALTLDCFNRNPEKVAMANCAQLVNNINALFLAHEEKCWTTPNFHVFEMYAAHQNALAVRAGFDAPEITDTGSEDPFWGLNGSASINGTTLSITAVNPSTDTPRQTRIVLHGAKAASARASILTGDDIHAHNTYERQDAVSIKRAEVRTEGRVLHFQFPPACVALIQAELA